MFLVVILALFASTQCYSINYYFHEKNGGEVNECIEKAIRQIMEETCVIFQHNPHAHNALFFMESRRCGFQESNSTVHLGAKCLDLESCTQLVHHAVTGERKHHSSVFRSLNAKFNCTDRCTLFCDNGGVVTPECKCTCGYGFFGSYCEKLKFADAYNDPSCGFIDAKSHGKIALANAVKRDTFCQWVLKSDDPFQTFEFEFAELNLNNEDAPPGQQCGDQLYVYGAKDVPNPIPCNSAATDEDGASALTGTKFVSTSNLLLVEYRANRFGPESRKGPLLLKYTVINPSTNDFPSLKYEQVSAGTSGSLNSFSFALFSTAAFALTAFHLFA